MFQVEDTEFVRAKGLQLVIALLTISVVNVCAISKDCLFVSLVSNRVSLEEVCLPSFDVLNCWFNLSASCLDDENQLPLKVILFSASRFALPSIRSMIIYRLVTSVFWSKVSTKSFHFSFCVRRCGSGGHNSVSAVQARWDFFYGGHLVHHIQYPCWYRFLVEPPLRVCICLR